MKLVHVNWYGFDHAKASELLNNVSYVCDLCVNGEYRPVAVYKAHAPDRSKGHKDYVLLTDKFIRGLDAHEIEKYRYHEGVHCLTCDEVRYSCMRHHCNSCSCGAVFADGGFDYLRVGYPSEKEALYQIVKIDLLEGKVIPKEYVDGNRSTDTDS